MNAGELRDHVRRAGVFAKDGSNIVRLVFDIDEAKPNAALATISATNDGVGSSEHRFAPESIAGGQHHIAFNFRYLTELAQVIPTKRVALDTTCTAAPGVFRPMPDDEAAEQPADNFLHVVMPMYVQW